jgi:hypothetical protein
MTPNNVREHLDAAGRVLRAARTEYNRGCGANAALFLRAAIGNLNQVAMSLENTAEVVRLQSKEVSHAR